jgi:urate oxidase
MQIISSCTAKMATTQYQYPNRQLDLPVWCFKCKIEAQVLKNNPKPSGFVSAL